MNKAEREQYEREIEARHRYGQMTEDDYAYYDAINDEIDYRIELERERKEDNRND